MGYENKYVQVDGLKTRYIEAGRGPVALLLHGASLGSSADVFERNLGPLAAAGVRAIAYDQPGFGLTDNPADYSVAYRRRFILGFLDALGIDRAALVGHSQAGGMAVSLAFEHPERVSRVMVLATGSLLPPLPAGQNPGGAPREGEEGTAAEPTIEQSRALLEHNLYNHALITPEVLETRHRMSVGKNFEAFVRRGEAARGGGARDTTPMWQRLVDLPCPLLIMIGKNDRGNAFERATLLKERYPQLDLHIVDRCRHLVQWDAADEFHRLAAGFLLD
ncbi:MAG TPA: alpha/beta hydrolase [candidate division Zixibacteria bacterium]|nr:alpha/beta hydrolase [candidate division Zixibacteria bacterium]